VNAFRLNKKYNIYLIECNVSINSGGNGTHEEIECAETTSRKDTEEGLIPF
jgi:hypothetical protein